MTRRPSHLAKLSIAVLAEAYDVVLTTGRTSVGHKDYVIQSLDALGDIDFHRVRVRPGKPIAAAHLPEYNSVAFAIPGKPVGAHTIAILVMQFFFVGDTRLTTVDAILTSHIGVAKSGFEYAVPVILNENGDRRIAQPLGCAGSPLKVYQETFYPSILSSSTRATRVDGFFLTETDVEANKTIRVIPYPVIE